MCFWRQNYSQRRAPQTETQVFHQGLRGGELPVAEECKQKLEGPEGRFLQGGPTPRPRVSAPAAPLLLRRPQRPLEATRLSPGGPAGPGQAPPRGPLCHPEHRPAEPLGGQAQRRRTLSQDTEPGRGRGRLWVSVFLALGLSVPPRPRRPGEAGGVAGKKQMKPKPPSVLWRLWGRGVEWSLPRSCD